jgi:hypothetical protein
MKIELKNISFSEAMSEETNAFTADLYINGKKVGYCKNQGCGGCTDYHTYSPEFRPVIAEAESYCKALPDINYGGTFSIKNNLEHVIDQLFEDWLKAKETKKFTNKMKTCILIGKPDENRSSYSYYNFKRPLSEIPVPQLQASIVRIKAGIKTGEAILNTNLTALGIQV